MSTNKNKEDFSSYDGGPLNGGSLAGVSVDTIKAYSDAVNDINKTRSNLRLEEESKLSKLRLDEAEQLSLQKRRDADEQELRRLEAERATAPRLTPMSGPITANSRERAAITAQRQASVWTPAKENYYRTRRQRLGYSTPEGEAEAMRRGRAEEIYDHSESIRTDKAGHWKRYWDGVNAKRDAQIERQKAKDALWDRRLTTVFGSDYVEGLQKTPGAAKQAREDLMNVSKYYHDNFKGLGDLIDAYVHNPHGSFGGMGKDALRLVETAVPKLYVKDAKGDPTTFNMDARADMKAVEKLSPKDKYTLTKAIMQFHRENPQALRDWQQLPKESLSSAKSAARGAKEQRNRGAKEQRNRDAIHRRLEYVFGKDWRKDIPTTQYEDRVISGLDNIGKFFANTSWSSYAGMVTAMAHDPRFRSRLTKEELSILLPDYYASPSSANPKRQPGAASSVNNPEAVASEDSIKKLTRARRAKIASFVMQHQRQKSAQDAKNKAKS